VAAKNIAVRYLKFKVQFKVREVREARVPCLFDYELKRCFLIEVTPMIKVVRIQCLAF
jgi:hypothetical protein